MLVFTDANAMLDPSALSRLTRHFADPRIGLVSGKGQFVERVQGSVLVVTNTYLRYEEFIREREKRLGYIVWADGALYALRRPLFRDLEPMHSNDSCIRSRRSSTAIASRSSRPRSSENHLRQRARGIQAASSHDRSGDVRAGHRRTQAARPQALDRRLATPLAPGAPVDGSALSGWARLARAPISLPAVPCISRSSSHKSRSTLSPWPALSPRASA